jgi:selenocysteine lyase/cysteine desulfurase
LGPKRGVVVDVVALPPEESDEDAIVARFEAAITPRTRVLSVSHILAWTGLVMPIAKLCAMARQHGLLTVIDGAQAVGQIALDMAALGCDAYAGSGHKWLLGPKGTGLLYVRGDPAERIRPLAWASGKRRLNVDSMGICPLPLVIGLAAAVARLDNGGLAAVAAHNLPLRHRLHEELGRLPGAQRVGPPPGAQACGLATIRMPDTRDADALRTVLASKYRILVRSVAKSAFNGLRVSAHVYNDDAQADALMAALRAELA